MILKSMVLAVCLVSLSLPMTSVRPVFAQTKPGDATPTASQSIMLTIFLKHDQSKPLAEIIEHMRKTRFYQEFPPPGTEIVSWVVAMGVGHIITLRVPPDRLRAVNRYFEERTWGAFRTEFFATYDFQEIAKELKKAP